MVEHLEAVLKVSEKFSILGGHRTHPTPDLHHWDKPMKFCPPPPKFLAGYATGYRQRWPFIEIIYRRYDLSITDIAFAIYFVIADKLSRYTILYAHSDQR